MAFAVFFGSAAVASIVGGRLTQRLGAGVALRAGVSIAAVVNVSIALQARSLTSLCVLLAVAGLGNAISQPAANLLIADHLPTDRLGLAIGLKQSGMPFATLLGGLAVPVLAQTLGWESAYVAAAGDRPDSRPRWCRRTAPRPLRPAPANNPRRQFGSWPC